MIQNRYLVVQLIGQGPAGDVYLAVDQRQGSAVALKRMFYKGDDSRMDVFEREANALTSLNHPVLPKVTDHFVDNDGLFIVMEHISGDDLGVRVESAGKPFPLSWVMFWADQILDALHYMHSHVPPIVHGDIKPRNLKLTGENHVILIDLGISGETVDTAITLPSLEQGTASHSFVAPEKMQGAEIDGRTDIYSLSATLYYLLTSTLPPDAAERVGAGTGSSMDPLRPLYELNSGVIRPVSEVIMQGLSLLPEERFNSAVEMQRALRRAFNKGAGSAVQDGQVPVHQVQKATEPAVQVQDAETVAFGDTSAAGENISMGATLQMDRLPVQSEPKQSEVKTEVFSAPPAAGDPAKTEAFPPAAPEPIPAAAAQNASSPPYQSQVTRVAAAKRSSSRAGLIIGVCIGLLVLAAAVAGGGWFAYKTYYGSIKPAVTPDVPPATPSATPTSEVVATEANSNTATEVELKDPYDPNANRKPVVAPTPDIVVTKTPKAMTQPTPAKTQKPVTRPTPKAQPRDDRTVILQ
jgi:serine/threonine protein kinase